MKKQRIIETIREVVYNMLLNDEFKEQYRMREQDFTRDRKLRFDEICLCVLKGSKRSLQAAINTFLKESKSEVEAYSKAAFSKARQNIKPEAFYKLFRTAVQAFYERAENLRTYKGYRVSAIDGTDYNLPNTEQLLEMYGSEIYGKGKIQVQAHGSCLYDVLNHILIDVSIAPYSANERELAEQHLEKLHAMSPGKELILMDRGYPSEKLICALEDYGFKYVMRANKDNFFKEIRKVTQPDETVERECGERSLKIRVIAIKIDGHTTETLITNIHDEFDESDFRYLYHLRWGIETKYDDIKNKLQVENFSGTTAISVQQDYYATMFIANLAGIIEYDLSDEVDAAHNNDENKYQYKLNINMTIATLKDSLIKAVLEDSRIKREKLYRNIEKTLVQCVVPVREGRHNPRKASRTANKFYHNNKLV